MIFDIRGPGSYTHFILNFDTPRDTLGVSLVKAFCSALDLNFPADWPESFDNAFTWAQDRGDVKILGPENTHTGRGIQFDSRQGDWRPLSFLHRPGNCQATFYPDQFKNLAITPESAEAIGRLLTFSLLGKGG